jgi:multicomponent Na+:H+ antiporter subunit D
MNAIAISPIVIPLLAGALCLVCWRSVRAQRWIAVGGAGLLLAGSLLLFAEVRGQGMVVTQAGGWPAPFGIALAVDLLGAMMVVLTALVGLMATVYSLFTMDVRRERFGFHPLVMVLLMGVNGACMTADLFNLYVWFEVLLMASFVLTALGGERGQMEGAIKYVTLNLVSSALFLAAIGLTYGLTHSLNMADVSLRLASLNMPTHEGLLAGLFFIAFGIKAAVFPLFFWLPASYHTMPVVVSALFAGLLTKVGVYALIRVFTLVLKNDPGFIRDLMTLVACLTMAVGVLGAVAQTEMRRILSFHIVSQIGYMLIGLALFTPLAMAGSVFYIAHHIIVKTNLFLISGAAARVSGGYELKKIGGLYASHPLFGLLFLVPALSLAGLPPFSGFWGKYVLVKAGLDAGALVVAVTALAVSVFTLISMMKIWGEAFWKPHPGTPPGGRIRGMLLPITAMATMTLAIGLYAEPLMRVSLEAAEQLLNPDFYIERVMGARV